MTISNNITYYSNKLVLGGLVCAFSDYHGGIYVLPSVPSTTTNYLLYKSAGSQIFTQVTKSIMGYTLTNAAYATCDSSGGLYVVGAGDNKIHRYGTGIPQIGEYVYDLAKVSAIAIDPANQNKLYAIAASSPYSLNLYTNKWGGYLNGNFGSSFRICVYNRAMYDETFNSIFLYSDFTVAVPKWTEIIF